MSEAEDKKREKRNKKPNSLSGERLIRKFESPVYKIYVTRNDVEDVYIYRVVYKDIGGMFMGVGSRLDTAFLRLVCSVRENLPSAYMSHLKNHMNSGIDTHLIESIKEIR